MKFPVFDLHCDTALALLGASGNHPHSLKRNTLHVDLERASVLPGYVQCFACFTTTNELSGTDTSPQMLFLQEKNAVLSGFNENADCISQVSSAAEIAGNLSVGKMSGLMTIEGPAGFNFDPARLAELYDMGFRITTLGWNERNPLTGSHITGGGLTERGREYVKEAQRLGFLVDVSHISDEGFWDIIDITSAPVIATHSNSRAVWNVSRNLTDDMFRAICQTGGVAGINLYSDFLGEKADLNTVCRHIIHFLSMDEDGRHIALGGDLDGCDKLPKGFYGVQDYPVLAEHLQKQGFGDGLIYNIFWNNAFTLMEYLDTKQA